MLWNQQKEVALLWKLSFNDVSSQYKDRFQYFLHQSWQDNTKLYCIVQCIIFRHVPHFILTLIIRIFKKNLICTNSYQLLPHYLRLSHFTINLEYRNCDTSYDVLIDSQSHFMLTHCKILRLCFHAKKKTPKQIQGASILFNLVNNHKMLKYNKNTRSHVFCVELNLKYCSTPCM